MKSELRAAIISTWAKNSIFDKITRMLEQYDDVKFRVYVENDVVKAQILPADEEVITDFVKAAVTSA